MRKYAFTSIFGLSILAGGLTVTEPAKAAVTLWRNFASTDSNPMFLDCGTCREGRNVVIRSYNGGASQRWTLSPAGTNGAGEQRVFIYSEVFVRPQPAPTIVAIMSANGPGSSGPGDENNGTALAVFGNNGYASQLWVPGPFVYDPHGALCYVFFSNESRSKVMGVSGNVMENDRPVIYWDFLSDSVNHADQAWCAYTKDASGNVVVQSPPPF